MDGKAHPSELVTDTSVLPRDCVEAFLSPSLQLLYLHREGLRPRASKHPESRLAKGRRDRSRRLARGCQFLSKATWPAVPSPSHSSPLSQACSLVGAPCTPAPCSGMGQVEASPHRGCCQESMHACAPVSVALEGDRLLSLSLGSGKPLGSRYTHLPSCTRSHLAGPVWACSPASR